MIPPESDAGPPTALTLAGGSFVAMTGDTMMGGGCQGHGALTLRGGSFQTRGVAARACAMTVGIPAEEPPSPLVLTGCTPCL